MAFAHPESIVEILGEIEGLSVADFGAGVGAYSVVLAQKVGEKGKVYAIEIQKDFLSKIKSLAESRQLRNIEILWGDIERLGATKLADNSVDVVVASNVLFQVEDKMGLVAGAKRVLAPEGRVLLVDWKDSFGGLGPHKDVIVLPDEAQQYFEDEGFTFVSALDAGDRHYGFVMKK